MYPPLLNVQLFVRHYTSIDGPAQEVRLNRLKPPPNSAVFLVEGANPDAFISHADIPGITLASFPCLDDSTNYENGHRTVALRYGFCEPCCGTEIVLRLERLLRQ